MIYGKVRLTPGTVTKVSQDPPSKRRRSNGRTKQVIAQSSKTAHPLAWAEALARCGGYPSRIEVIDEWHLAIHNDPEWRKKR